MPKTNKWNLTKQQQVNLTEALTQELVLLRARLGISQAELSKLIGVSRQTYSAVENGYRAMSWNTYLALICFYDNNIETQQMLRRSDAYPTVIFTQMNNGKTIDESRLNVIAGIPSSITDKLDEQALYVIRTAVMLEYARCTKLPSDVILRTFDGVNLAPNGTFQQDKLHDALKQLAKTEQ